MSDDPDDVAKDLAKNLPLALGLLVVGGLLLAGIYCLVTKVP